MTGSVNDLYVYPQEATRFQIWVGTRKHLYVLDSTPNQTLPVPPLLPSPSRALSSSPSLSLLKLIRVAH